MKGASPDAQPALFRALPSRDHPDCLRLPRQPLPYVPTFAAGQGEAAQKDYRVQLEVARREKALGKLGALTRAEVTEPSF